MKSFPLIRQTKFHIEVLGLLLVAQFFMGCRSSKDLTFMDDANINKTVGRSMPSLNYKIKVNDNLFVSVISRDPEMNKIYNPSTAGNAGTNAANNMVWSSVQGQFIYGYLVDADGYINLPSMGKVKVIGMTIEECQSEIQALATQYLKDVSTKVRLLNFKVTVLGEVTTPGVHYNYNPEFTVFDALSMASGAKNTAVLTNVLVLREVGDQIKTFKLNLKSTTVFMSDGYNLLPNDIVIVQPGKNKNLELQSPIYSVVLSSLAVITSVLLVLSYNHKL